MIRSFIKLNEEQKLLEESYKKFIEKEILPFVEKWYSEDRQVDHKLYRKLGDAGFLCSWADEKYGGHKTDFMNCYVICNAMAQAGVGGVQTWLHSDIVAPYIADHGSEELKDRYMPDIVKGNKVLAVAMTEPDAGSDLASIRSTAVKDGDDYIINGSKIFISNGYTADLIVTAVKTDPTAGPKGVSLILIDATATTGITRNKLDKMGCHIQDTAEIFFDNVRVPQKNLLGKEGYGFVYLMKGLQQERLLAALMAQGAAERALGLAVDYAKQRKIFGKTVSQFQNTQFKLAELTTKLIASRALIDQLVIAHANKEDVGNEVIAAKLMCTELVKEAVDTSLQVHGGYGYMMEYPIARMYVDARVCTIAGGTSEIMKEIIGRDLFKK